MENEKLALNPDIFHKYTLYGTDLIFLDLEHIFSNK